MWQLVKDYGRIFWILIIGLFLLFLYVVIFTLVGSILYIPQGPWLQAYLTLILASSYVFAAVLLYQIKFHEDPYGKRKAMLWFFLLLSVHGEKESKSSFGLIRKYEHFLYTLRP